MGALFKQHKFSWCQSKAGIALTSRAVCYIEYLEASIAIGMAGKLLIDDILQTITREARSMMNFPAVQEARNAHRNNNSRNSRSSEFGPGTVGEITGSNWW